MTQLSPMPEDDISHGFVCIFPWNSLSKIITFMVAEFLDNHVMVLKCFCSKNYKRYGYNA